MKKIVFLNQDAGYLIIDIANSLSKINYDIELITGRLVVRNKNLADSVNVTKIIKYYRNSKIQRLFSWIVAFIQILYLVKTKYRKDYLFIFTNPPFNTFLPLFCRNRFSLMIFDIYPDVLIQTGILNDNSLLTKFWMKMNKKVFNRADNIFTLSTNMSLVLRQSSANKQISIVPLWGDSSFFNPIPKKSNPFVIEHKLEERFVVIYSGNLGATHNVEIFADIARLIKNPKVFFLIIGEGDQKKNLEAKIRKYTLNNCLLLPLLPVDRIPYSFSSADLAIVSLGKGASSLSLPSKTFSFMSAGLPLLCISGENSELNKLVTRYKNGRSFLPDQTVEMAAFIEEIANNNELLDLYKLNTIKASLDFTPGNAVIITERIVRAIEETR